MKPDYWKRLARFTRQVSAELPAEMPFGFDTRVIAQWRARPNDSEPLPWNGLLRGALACSAAIMLLALFANFRAASATDQNELAAADSVVTLSLLQSQ